MPCRYDEPIGVYRNNCNHRPELDRLTAENDALREALLKITLDPDYKLPQRVKKAIELKQLEHRKADLKRLEATFRKNRDAERLGLVILADPTKELEPQLGFDADKF